MESQAQLEKKFGKMGARVKLGSRPRTGGVSLDIGRDKRGAFFDIRANKDLELQVLDIRPDLRHLLLLAKELDANPTQPPHKHKFLCGHDERDWFVAAVPGDRSSTVLTAFEALKPPEVIAAQAKHGVSGMRATRRKNNAYIRQGEWFFLPAKNLKVEEDQVRHNELLSRGTGSKPHVAEFGYRLGGEVRWVCREYPSGITPEARTELLQKNPDAKFWRWQSMMLNAEVYVRGTVRHPDHRTIYLGRWSRVWMNLESRSASGKQVLFLD